MSAFPLPPGSTIGILGGGQLGRMLALAAARLGFDTVVLTPEPDACAARVATRSIVAPYDDLAALEALSLIAAVATFEFENVPAAVVDPSGQPATARMCCSNWSTSQPSRVQWPEL